jgi:hypothetical protein
MTGEAEKTALTALLAQQSARRGHRPMQIKERLDASAGLVDSLPGHH